MSTNWNAILGDRWTDYNGIEHRAPSTYEPIVYPPPRRWCIVCRKLRVCFELVGLGNRPFCEKCAHAMTAPIHRPAWPPTLALRARVSQYDLTNDRRTR